MSLYHLNYIVLDLKLSHHLNGMMEAHSLWYKRNSFNIYMAVCLKGQKHVISSPFAKFSTT
jgi:hypothetical protein